MALDRTILRPRMAAVLGGATTGAILPLYAVTLFVSALLLFWVQPMFTKMVLPLLGGAPGVWNTAVVFFQATLLAGYAYAHATTRILGLRRQVPLHVGILALAFIALPIAVAAGWDAPPESAPIPWLLGLLAVSVGLPFFAVSATAPLLQKWFAHSDHGAASDPYFLYSASNLGSLLALLGYPILMEPLLTLDGQSRVWTAGYALLVALIAACALVPWRCRTAGARSAGPAAEAGAVDAPGWRQRLWWLVLALVPSSLLLGVTTHITTDVAAAPLLWVVPLALYLLTFVIAFARRPVLKHAWMVRAQPFVLIPLALVFWINVMSWGLSVAWHLLAFFVSALVCHGELVRRRPSTDHLTEFYLWMSLGGVLGGAFNAIVAPVVFTSVYEYPLALAAACLLRPALAGQGQARARWWDVILPAALFTLVAVPAFRYGPALIDLAAGDRLALTLGALLLFVPLGLVVLSFADRPVRFGLGLAVALVATSNLAGGSSDILARERSFFGVYTVKRTADDGFHTLQHGTTLHGAQHTDPALRREPLTYYHRDGPLGQVFAALAGRRIERVGAVGLGTGTVACYRQPGQTWVFYEIDPLVERLARDGRYFHYLADCAEDAPVIIGDARLTLARAPDRSYDLLILDAFSSDAIPLHLLTREALALYAAKLAEDGILMFHISNRHLDLAPVLGNLVADAGLVGKVRLGPEPVEGAGERYRTASRWVAIARDRRHLAALDADPGWTPLEAHARVGLWTDNFSNLFDALKW